MGDFYLLGTWQIKEPPQQRYYELIRQTVDIVHLLDKLQALVPLSQSNWPLFLGCLVDVGGGVY